MAEQRLVGLPADAARPIAYACRREARRLLYGTKAPSRRDIRHANRLLVFSELIDPPKDDRDE